MKRIYEFFIKVLITSMFLLTILLCEKDTAIYAEAATKKVSISYDEWIYGKKHSLSLNYTGKEKLKKVEYKRGEITSTKNSKWKDARNVTKKFSSNKKINGKWFSGTKKGFSFKTKGYVTFRFTTSSKKKYIKTIYVNPKPKTVSGECTLTGTVKKVRWEHPNGEMMTTYVLQLSSPKNIRVVYNWDGIVDMTFCKQKRVHITGYVDKNIDIDRYVGKKVKITGRLWEGAGTIYYIENTCIDVESIVKQ